VLAVTVNDVALFRTSAAAAPARAQAQNARMARTVKDRDLIGTIPVFCPSG
jgi:hypothetical protein